MDSEETPEPIRDAPCKGPAEKGTILHIRDCDASPFDWIFSEVRRVCRREDNPRRTYPGKYRCAARAANVKCVIPFGLFYTSVFRDENEPGPRRKRKFITAIRLDWFWRETRCEGRKHKFCQWSPAACRDYFGEEMSELIFGYGRHEPAYKRFYWNLSKALVKVFERIFVPSVVKYTDYCWMNDWRFPIVIRSWTKRCAWPRCFGGLWRCCFPCRREYAEYTDDQRTKLHATHRRSTDDTGNTFAPGFPKPQKCKEQPRKFPLEREKP